MIYDTVSVSAVGPDGENMKQIRLKKAFLRRDKKGEMGIGTMIIFIAMVLVAAIAAALLITTASQLNQRAQETGTIAEQEVSTGMMMRNLQGDRLINGEGPNAVMPAVDDGAPTVPTFTVTAVEGDRTGGTNYKYGYKISILTSSSDTKSGIMKEELYRSEDGVIGETGDTLIQTTSYLAGNLLTTSTVILDAPTQGSTVDSDDPGAGVFYYYFRIFDRAGNTAYTTVSTDQTDSNKLLASDYTITAVNTTTGVITIDEATSATGIDDDEYIGYGLLIEDASASSRYVYPITDSAQVSDGSGGFDFEFTIDATDLTDLSFVLAGTDDLNIIGLDRMDSDPPSAPELTFTGEFKAISQGAGSGRIRLEITGLDLSGELDAVEDENGTLIYWGTDGPSSNLGRIKGYNVYRIQGRSASSGGRPPNVIPIGFWSLDDFTMTSTGIYSSTWTDYIEITNGNEKTAYSYAIAAVSLTGNEGNSYHYQEEDMVGDALWTAEPCATSSTADITLPSWNTYSITATAGASAVTISWTAAALPTDSGSGMAFEDFQGQVNHQENEVYAYEVWRGLEPLFEVKQLPVNGNVNPLVTLAGYAKISDTSFEDYGIDWTTGQKKGFEGNVYYYGICAVDNSGNRILKPGLSDNLEVIEMQTALQAGSPGVDFDLVRVELTDGSTAAGLSFGGIGEASDAAASTFVVQVIRDVDGDFVRGNVLTQGSIVKIIINCNAIGFKISPQTHVSMSIMPKHGNPARESFTTPSTYVDRYVELI